MLGGKSAVVHLLHYVFEVPEPGAGVRALWEDLTNLYPCSLPVGLTVVAGPTLLTQTQGLIGPG